LAKRAKKEERVDSCRHEAETRKNAVPVGLVSNGIFSGGLL
jgi:hypothetical protein